MKLAAEGLLLQTWKMRHFQQRDNILFYYANEKSDKPLGKIDLLEVRLY